MSDSQIGRAIICIAHEHTGDTVLGLIFQREVAGDRAIRVVFDIVRGSTQQDLPIDAHVLESYWPQGATSRGMPSGAIAFRALEGNSIHPSDIVETIGNPQLTRQRWCVLDVKVTDPARIIPATILVPYAQQPNRCNAELDKTDMLPLWFRQTNGTLGVPIIADFSCLPDTPSRVTASSLKVGFWWCNYGPLEKQIQLRSKSTSNQPDTHVTIRRLAKLISGAVQNAMNTYEQSTIRNIRYTDWQDRRYRIGTDAGYISDSDDVLCVPTKPIDVLVEDVLRMTDMIEVFENDDDEKDVMNTSVGRPRLRRLRRRSSDDDGVIKLWDSRTLSAESKPTREYTHHFDFVSDLLWLEDKKQLVATSGDGTLSVMDVRSKKTEPFAQRRVKIKKTSYSPSHLYAVGTQLGVLSIFSRHKGWGDCVDRIPGHPHSVDALCSLSSSYPSSSNTLLTGSSDGLLRVVELFPTKLVGVVVDHRD
ncbi:hypothetical protein PENSPDRAFT_751683 [Peniophora sp. CONT]|nr:hypothetical protein PENSPDRAFT_751683 [Peniophora sp. CONT]